MKTHNGNPAVNVKCYNGLESLKEKDWAEIRSEHGLGEDFDYAYCLSVEAEDCSGSWFELACQDGFEQAKELAKELFGSGITVSQEGRSGGWIEVRGLPDIEDVDDSQDDPTALSWDTVLAPFALGEFGEGEHYPGDTLRARWAYFERACASIVAELPYSCAVLIGINRYEQDREEKKQEAEEEAIQVEKDLARDVMREALDRILYHSGRESWAGSLAASAIERERAAFGMNDMDWKTAVASGREANGKS